jgi:hypothetical protein
MQWLLQGEEGQHSSDSSKSHAWGAESSAASSTLCCLLPLSGSRGCHIISGHTSAGGQSSPHISAQDQCFALLRAGYLGIADLSDCEHDAVVEACSEGTARKQSSAGSGSGVAGGD